MPQSVKMRHNIRRIGSEPDLGTEVVRIRVGPRQREFTLHRKLLCSTSPYFRERLSTAPASPATSNHSEASSGKATSTDADDLSNSASGRSMLWLSTEVPEMFELFVLWLYQRRAFSSLVERAITQVEPDSCNAALSGGSRETDRCTLHWNLVRLHLFAAKATIPTLQDAAMDALQDLYLRCDWEVSPQFVRFLYTDCYAEHAFRIRKWAVAMAAWSIAMQGGEPSHDWQLLLQTYPVLDHDYRSHLQKMAGSRGANLSIKNPQLRLPANRLRSEERFFGFRQCSFHSHRSAVGEGPCPHGMMASSTAAAIDVRKTAMLNSLPASAPRRAKYQMESDESDHGSPSPLSVYIRNGFYLDVS